VQTTGLSVWFGMISIVAGVGLTLAGLVRYRRTRVQLERDSFEPAGFIIDLVAVVIALFGLGLGGYLLYIETGWH
jgi:uncharacterized membrane protein YidH (DUF202 family)